MPNANALRDMIQDTMLIDDPVTGSMVPFIFRKVQNKYYDLLVKDYGSQWWFEDLDELIVKARKEGFTSFWLAVFAAILTMFSEPRRFLEISYKLDATKQHFRRMRGFLLSPIIKDPKLWTEKLFQKVFSVYSEGSEMVLRANAGSFYIGTATGRTGERGGTVQGVLFSEAASYQDTTIITASEIIEGTRQMVAVGTGLKVVETTAKGFNHLRRRWVQAVNKEISARPRFLGWKEMYTPAEFEKIKAGFSDKSLIPQEYPETADEAFLVSGRPMFDSKILRKMEALVSDVVFEGALTDNGSEIEFDHHSPGELKIWKTPKPGRKYLIAGDVAGGVSDESGLDPLKADNRCWSVGTVFDRASWEVVAELRLRCDPGNFGRKLSTLGEYFNWAIVAPELNNMGQATLEALRADGYPHIFRADDIWPDGKKHLGFPTDERTKSLSLTALRNGLDDMVYKENSITAIYEMFEAVHDEHGRLSSSGWLDTVITRMIGLYLLKFYSLDETYRHKEHQDSPMIVTSLVGQPTGTRERFRIKRSMV